MLVLKACSTVSSLNYSLSYTRCRGRMGKIKQCWQRKHRQPQTQLPQDGWPQSFKRESRVSRNQSLNSFETQPSALCCALPSLLLDKDTEPTSPFVQSIGLPRKSWICLAPNIPPLTTLCGVQKTQVRLHSRFTHHIYGLYIHI